MWSRVFTQTRLGPTFLSVNSASPAFRKLTAREREDAAVGRVGEAAPQADTARQSALTRGLVLPIVDPLAVLVAQVTIVGAPPALDVLHFLVAQTEARRIRDLVLIRLDL